MMGKKDKPFKKVAKLAEVEHIDDDNDSSEFETDSDDATVSSHDSSSQNIEGKSGKKKVKHQPGLMTKVLKKKKLKKTQITGLLTMMVVNPGAKLLLRQYLSDLKLT